MKFCELTDRGVVRVAGDEARHFLQGLITADVDAVSDDAAQFGALLTPQGKILFDFLVFGDGDALLLDTLKSHAGDLAKRLIFYKLRAKVEIADLSDSHMVIAAWDGAEDAAISGFAADPRHDGLGRRRLVERADFQPPEGWRAAGMDDWDGHRLSLSIPEAGRDYAYGDVFPHDVDMDALNGVDFEKGCYVGQEVVSRMQHRATARRRIISVSAETPLPASGTEMEAGGKIVGTLGSSVGKHGLALVRLDRAKSAIDGGAPILAGDLPVRLTIPDWAGFDWPSGDTN